MKTAISVPDSVFDRVNRLSTQHDLNRSEFFTEAARRYADLLESSDITAQVNAALEVADTGQAADRTTPDQSNGEQAFLHQAAANLTQDNPW